MNVLDLASKKVKLRKVSTTSGGEYQGPCPACGGDDRFHVWPAQHDGKGSYWCRGCGKAGDNIQFLIDFEGLTFKEACEQLRIHPPERSHRGPSVPQRAAYTPNAYAAPAELWQEKAGKFIAWASGNLAKNSEVLQWLMSRGISSKAMADYRLGWNPGEDGKDIYRSRKAWGLPEFHKPDGRLKALWIPRGLVIPWIVDGVVYRIRIRRPEGEPRYYVLPGSSMSTMILERTRRAFVVVEAELDAIAIIANTNLAGAVALGSNSPKPDAETYQLLQGALQILLALDYDEAGKKAVKWWAEHFDRCDRWPVPQGKDPGEAYKMGTDLDQWIKAGLPPALTMNSLEFRVESSELKNQGATATTQQCHPEPFDKLRIDPVEGSLPPPLIELRDLLRKNPGVKIINTKDRFTVLRHGKYVGGRIGDLVFKQPQVTDYLMNHPAEEIDGGNLIR